MFKRLVLFGLLTPFLLWAQNLTVPPVITTVHMPPCTLTCAGAVDPIVYRDFMFPQVGGYKATVEGAFSLCFRPDSVSGPTDSLHSWFRPLVNTKYQYRGTLGSGPWITYVCREDSFPMWCALDWDDLVPPYIGLGDSSECYCFPNPNSYLLPFGPCHGIRWFFQYVGQTGHSMIIHPWMEVQ